MHRAAGAARRLPAGRASMHQTSFLHRHLQPRSPQLQHCAGMDTAWWPASWPQSGRLGQALQCQRRHTACADLGQPEPPHAVAPASGAPATVGSGAGIGQRLVQARDTSPDSAPPSGGGGCRRPATAGTQHQGRGCPAEGEMRDRGNTPARSGSIASTWVRSQTIAGGVLVKLLEDGPLKLGAAARSSRPPGSTPLPPVDRAARQSPVPPPDLDVSRAHQYGYGDSCPTGEDGALNNGACSTGCWTWQVCRQSSRIQRPGLPESSAASQAACSVPVSGTTEIGLSATAITPPARERSGRSAPMGGGPSDPPATRERGGR